MADAQEYGSPAKRRRFASTGEEERLFAASEGDPVQVESFAGDSGFSELPTLAAGEDETPVLPLMGDEAAVEEEDDSSSITSDVSDISGLTDLSNHDWEPNSGCISWVQQQMISGIDPRTVLSDLVPSHAQIPGHLDNYTLWKIIINIVSEPPRRQKLQSVNSINDVVRLLQSCKKILVLTGAGISVSCGIPDFRSRDGVYARLAVDFPDLPDPQAMFDIHYFRKDPRPFFKFARELWPGQFTPSRCHRFIRQIEKHKKLLRNYTQNIDTLEQQADISNVIQCHGSFATATCMQCKYRVPASTIQADIMNQKIPLCPKCVPEDTEYVHDPQVGAHNAAIMKPDIVFFGEGLPEEFHDSMARDKDECDLILVIGSSLKVRPVALIPSALPPHVPQILINREPLRHMNFDVELLGDCDVIVNQLCHLLGEGWSEDICHKPPLHEIDRIPEKLPALPKRLEEPHRRDSGLSSASSEPESSEESVGPCTSWWVPRSRANLGDSLPDQTFLRMTGGRYIFPGAELFYEFGDDFSDSVDSLDASD